MLSKIVKIATCSLVGLYGLLPNSAEATNCSRASFYGRGDGFAGRLTASGTVFDPYSNTVAHKYYSFGTKLKVTNMENNASTVVVVRDRGPYVGGRALDMSYGSFSKIASPSRGVINICYSRI
jgi:rare lipoprotein A